MTSVYKALGFLLLRSYSSDGGLFGTPVTCELHCTQVFHWAFSDIQEGLFELVTLQPAQEQILVNSFKGFAEEKKSVGRERSLWQRENYECD